MSGATGKVPRKTAQAPAQTPPSRTLPARSPPMRDADRDELQALLDAVPPPFEPLDVGVLDGFLCGVLVQPQVVPQAAWLQHVTDADGRSLPRTFDAARLYALVRRRHAELDDAIQRRAWFDPWVFESEPESEGDFERKPEAAREAASTRSQDDEPALPDDGSPDASDDVYPWVAGFVTALELFPALMAGDAASLTVPLALLYRHLDPDDLEDADEVLAEIESMEPPADLSDAVEGLVRATLLLADVGRPLVTDGGTRQPARRGSPAAARPSRPRR